MSKLTKKSGISPNLIVGSSKPLVEVISKKQEPPLTISLSPRTTSILEPVVGTNAKVPRVQLKTGDRRQRNKMGINRRQPNIGTSTTGTSAGGATSLSGNNNNNLQKGDIRLKTIKEEAEINSMTPQQLHEYSKKIIGKLSRILLMAQKILNEDDDIKSLFPTN